MRTLLALPVVLSLTGCGLFGPPDWVNTYPQDDDYVYAVGQAGETYDSNPARSEEIAVQRALDYLARQIRVRVQSSTVLSDVQSFTKYESDTLQMSDEDLEGVELVEVWVDKSGSVSKRPNTTYVLIRMSRERAEKLLARSP